MMNKSKYLIIALLFLIFCGVIIFCSNLTVLFFPTQEDKLKGEFELGALTKDFLIIQEFTMTKEYLTAVDLVMISSDVQYRNENTLMLLDSNYQTLYSRHFTNENMDKPKYRPFELPEKIHVGKGKKVIICLSTTTGNKDNHLAVPRITTGTLGKLSVMPIINDDVTGTLKDSRKVFLLDGSLCMRTYESNYGFLNWFKIFLFFLAFLSALLIIFAKKIKPFIVRLTIIPEKTYLILALVFGLVLVFITPPFQVPDEDQHIYRSYQLAEFNIFQYDSSVPNSLVKLFGNFSRMNSNPLEKTSIGEILSQKKVELNPQDRSQPFVPKYIFPYLPQALGVFIGKTLDCSPILFLYMGRALNLLFSVGLIYLAIRITPFFKWIFLLLGLMPMTLFLCASLSKDAMIISLAFLLIALFLRFAYDHQKKISTKDLVILFAISFLVATTRSIYAILIGMYLLIPLYKIGSLKKYIIIFMGLIITVFLATQIGALKPLFQPKAAVSALPVINLTLPPSILSPPALTLIGNFNQSDLPQIPEGINFIGQTHFILNNPIQYLGIMLNSLFITKRTLYLDSFIGILGWLNQPLPKWHINLYLGILLITAFLYYNKKIEIRLTDKLIILAMFITGVILIETGLYLTWTPVGQNYIEGVQGRYFIPYAPLFFLFLYNTSLWKYINIILTSRANKTVKTKRKNAVKPDFSVQDNRQIILSNFFNLLIVFFSVISLLSTVYVVLTKYYVILI